MRSSRQKGKKRNGMAADLFAGQKISAGSCLIGQRSVSFPGKYLTPAAGRLRKIRQTLRIFFVAIA